MRSLPSGLLRHLHALGVGLVATPTGGAGHAVCRAGRVECEPGLTPPPEPPAQTRAVFRDPRPSPRACYLRTTCFLPLLL